MRSTPRRGTARSGSAASTISPPGSRPCDSLRHASGGSGWTLPGSRCKAATPRSSCATWPAASPSWGTRSTPTWSGCGSPAPRSRLAAASAGRAARCCSISRRAPTPPPSRTSGSSTPASPTGRCCTGASRHAPTAAACWRSGSGRSPSPRGAADLEARAFDLESARPFLDRLPLAGRLSGRTLAEGAIGALHLETDWVFRDSLVPGWPQSTVRGRGEVDLSRGAGVGFRSFAVDAATIDLRTVRRLVPAVRLQGALDAAGTLTGRLAGAQFRRTLRHRPRDLPPRLIRGVVRLDSRSDPLPVFAARVAGSLSFDGLRGSFLGGGLPLAGAVTGPVRLDGTLAALATHADLQSAQDGGGVRVDGVLTLLASRLGARDATVRTRELDLSRWLAAPAAPSSRLSGTLAGSVGADSGAAPAGAGPAAPGPSLVAGAGLDSGVARLRFADRRVYVDSLRLSQPGLITTGSGVLGWARPARGTLSLDLDADSLNSVDSLIAWVAGRALGREGGGGGGSLAGAARVAVTLEGALGSLAVEARASLERLRWREWEVPAGGAPGRSG